MIIEQSHMSDVNIIVNLDSTLISSMQEYKNTKRISVASFIGSFI